MGRTPMYVDWQNLYCENACTLKSHLQIVCNTHQNSNDILQRTGGKVLKYVWRNKDCDSHSNLKQRGHVEASHYLTPKLYYKAPVTKIVWHWYTEMYTPVEHKREPGDKATWVWTPIFHRSLTKRQPLLQQKTTFSINGHDKTVYLPSE